MVGRYRALMLIVVMLLSGASFASAEEAPVDSPPVEDDVQSRGIIGAPTQLSLSVQFAFRVYGSGRLDGLIGKEAFSCPPACTKTIRAGTPIQMKAAATNSFYQFSRWQGCTGQITGASCQMTVPSNTLAASVTAIFITGAEALKEQFCRDNIQLCSLCTNPDNAGNPLCLEIPR